jgi:hypothetical protein
MTLTETRRQPIAELLSRTQLGPRQAGKSLSLWPLCLREDAGPAAGPAYVSLGNALDAGRLRVDEVHEQGEVPHVRVANEGELAVLVLFGEELRGAKQNRIANASFLVPARSEVVLDVSCVEAGRWQRGSGERFRAADEVISHSLRKKIAGQVALERQRGAGFSSDQGEVWHEIGERLRRSETVSRTDSYADYRAGREKDLSSLLRSFRALPRQVGFVAAIGDAVSGVEAIGRPEVFGADFQALLRAYAIDAVDASIVRELEKSSDVAAARFEDPALFLEALAAADAIRTPSLGLGDDLRLRGDSVGGCALVQGEVVHLTGFPA